MRYVLPVALVACLFPVVSMAAVRNASEKEIVVVKAALAEKLKDPDSMKLKNVQIAEDGTLCGDVNAKNSYGGYTGFSRFIGMYFSANKEGKPVAIIIGIDSKEGISQKMCADRGM